jgi:hypothetical protein
MTTLEAILVIGAIVLGVTWVGLMVSGAVISVVVTDDRTIVVQEKLGAHGENGNYLVIDTDSNVYSVEDNYLLGSFDASNRYAKLQSGGMYKIHTHGIRLPLLSWYPNIMSSTQAISLESNSCYLKGAANESVV